jgi:hypothetical protein
MPLEATRFPEKRQGMSIGSRRVFRLGLVVSLATAIAYAMALPLPYMAPIFAILLTLAPKPPLGAKGLLVLIALAALTTGTGLLIIPLLTNYPFTAILVVLVALFLSTYITVSLGQSAVGMLLTIGITLISAVGTVSFVGAIEVIKALLFGIAITILCQWLVYPFFPEDPGEAVAPEAPADDENSLWITLRATLIVMPVYLICLTNPSMYMPLIMKSVSLAQQSSVVDARVAAKTLLGSTLMGGLLAILLWFALKLHVNLWMFFLWILLIGILVASKIYGLSASKFPADFWVNSIVTMLILVGPAVADSASGKDVYQAFFVRMSLFIVVTIYALITVLALDSLRASRRKSRSAIPAMQAAPPT